MKRIRIKQWMLVWISGVVLLAGCAGTEVVSQEEISRQNKVDGIVSQELFARKLDEHASYNIHTDGFVAIKFDESVSFQAYADMVEWMRARPEIKGVRATVSGMEVCPPRR